MFPRVDNLKQHIAVAAILLSLSTLAQNAGFYCALGACRTGEVASSAEPESCCHKRVCHSDEKPAPQQGQEHQHRHDSCPCPDSCWCHQAPQPIELPTSFDETFELAVFAICNDLVAGGLSDEWTSLTWSAPPDLDDESALRRCAKLCRFLI
ncbi:MAG: hypothetical protein CMJ58_03365 [Planctomycetaceae bacterium]|nr:hypothetical protein [Planctomycetaceae bacterium]